MVSENTNNGQSLSDDPADGGSGGKTARTDSGRTEIQDARLRAIAVQRGWIKGKRWPTDQTVHGIVGQAEGRPLTIRETVAVAVGADAQDGDPRTRGIACRTAVAMERQNQFDEHLEIKLAVEAASPGGAATIINNQIVNQVNVGAQAGEVAKELLNDPEYLDYCRSRAVESDAGSLCPDGFGEAPPAVENGEAPRLNGQGHGRNGHGTNGTDPSH
jgi:hypothetical protein